MSPISKQDIEGISAAVADQLRGAMVTKQDLAQGLTGLHEEIRGELAAVEGRLSEGFSDLQASVDRYLKRTEGWHDEFNVLKARYDRLVHVLDEKGLVREEETHLA